MEMKYLLDSVILIDHFNNIGEATRYLRDHGNSVSISVITRAEVLAGFADDTWRRAASLLDCFPIYPIERGVADMASVLRRSLRLRLADAFQASIAQMNNLILVTRNTKDFPIGKYDFAITPYTLS